MPSASSTSSLPYQQSAIVALGAGKLTIQHDVPITLPGPGRVLVRTGAVALNPADAKMLDYSPAPGAVHGCDFAGTVVALGKDVKNVSVGDRVAGPAHGMNQLQPDVGAFAQYVGTYADLLLKIPDRMSFEEAATLGTGVATAALSLFQEMRVPASLAQLREPRSKTQNEVVVEGREFVLVAGGSTASGTRAIQLLRLAGLRPIATASPANFDLVLRFGAEKVFDYRSPTCATDIRAYTSGELAYALDCISQADTTQLCYAAIGRAGGRYVSLEPFRDTVARTRALTVEPSWIMATTMFGQEIALDGEYAREARPEDRRFTAEAFAAVQSLLERGFIDVHPIKRMQGGWEGVVKGVDLIRNQALSGQKMVYAVA
ncbi:MAG: hypothetical protein Q9219_004480 [cf. Caloplaca sp. 3 TL-2023]